jgi:hypothetical protein
MISFEIGTTYSTRMIGDHNAIVRITVAARTAKTIVTTEGKRLRIYEYNGDERVNPCGRYSMAPVISASDTKALEADKPDEAYRARLRALAEAKFGAFA